MQRRNSGKAGVGVSERVEGNGNYETQKNIYQLFLLLFSNHVDLKNNNRNCRKPF